MRIDIDIFNSSSLQQAIDYLDSGFLKDIESKVDRLCKELAEAGSITAQSEYGGKVQVSYEKVDGTLYDSVYKIVANGSQVCFLEFGAGVLTDSGHKYAKKMPFEVEPGSWSKYHKGTYQIWLENGKDGEYPYNLAPKRGLLRAEENIKYLVVDMAREIFGE